MIRDDDGGEEPPGNARQGRTPRDPSGHMQLRQKCDGYSPPRTESSLVTDTLINHPGKTSAEE